MGEIDEELETADQATVQAENVLTALKSLGRFRFEDIDQPGNQRTLDELEARLTSLSAPQSEAAKAKKQWEHSKSLLSAAEEEHQNALLAGFPVLGPADFPGLGPP